MKFVSAFIGICFLVLALYNTGALDSVLDKAGELTGEKEQQVNLPGRSLLNAKQESDPEDCVVKKKAVPIELSKSKYPLTLDHAQDAIKKGEARILHLDREGADDNRDESLQGIATKDGFDRDEYPPAASSEGGEGASVRYVPYSDNRGAGSSMGAQLSEFCSGQAFVIVPGP